MRNIRLYFIQLILLFCWLTSSSQVIQEVPVFRHIQENKTDSVVYFLEQGNDINGLYGRNTLLEMAIVFNQVDVVKLLLEKKANVNLQNNKSTPLFVSVIYGEEYQSNEILEILVSHNANIDFVGVSGLTPLTLACKVNNSLAARYLYERGADPTQKDRSGNDFFYYALRGNDPDLIQYFVSKGFEIPRMESVNDGPYIRIQENEQPEVRYMHYDNHNDKAEWLPGELKEGTKGLPAMETIKYLTNKNNLKNADEYRKSSDIFVVSDIHGHYENFIHLLTANNIIDKNLSWVFGKGQLVIVGDVFDRGDMVTECLWLIFNLEYQAQKSGGMVHYLLGNHELMIIKDNNKSYAHDKYILPYAKTGIDYHDLFSQDYVLGKWLRSKNIAVKINKLLFVHGGIPPDFVNQGRTLSQMNQAINNYLADTSGIETYDNDLIIEPTWYRGYFKENDMAEELEQVCKFYKVDKVIVGHTPVEQIKLLQDTFVIGVGIHFTGPDRPAQGLLIRDGKFYRCDEKGIITQL